MPPCRDSRTGARSTCSSHELRTPITTIYGAAQVLRKLQASESESSSAPELLTDLALETERLHRLVEDLLVLSRFERGRLEMSMEPVLVNRVVEGAARRVADVAPRLALQIRTDVDVPPVAADPTYLEQVLRNLVSNAVKYAGEAAHVLIDVASADGIVRVRVEDDGPGIPEEDRTRIFELYERLDDAVAQPGSGIGLFVCRQLIEAMGGTIAVGRAESGGARFTIELPAIAQDLLAEPGADPQQLVAAGDV